MSRGVGDSGIASLPPHKEADRRNDTEDFSMRPPHGMADLLEE